MAEVSDELDKIPQQKLGLFNLIHGDPLGEAIGHFAIKSPVVAALVTAFTGFSAALVTTFEGNFINPGLNLDLASDIGWWNQFVFAIATLIYIAGAYFGAFPRTLNQLVETGVIQASDQEWKKVRRFTLNKLTSNTAVYLPYICGSASAITSFLVIQGQGAWFDIGTYYAGWLVPIHSFMLYFLLTYLAQRLYYAFLILKMLFSFKVNIQPFHTDGCGGLGSLKNQSANLYVGLLVFGFISAGAIISNATNYGLEMLDGYNLSLLASYVFITSIAFFLPLYATSSRMDEAQTKFLASIKSRYKAIQSDTDDDVVGKGSNDDILALQALRATARSMQVWPFDYSTMVKFVGVVGSPFAALAIFTILNL